MAAPFVRRDVWNLPAGDPTLAWYADAVAAMQQRDPTDPTSWAYQAAMHGTYSTPGLRLWNTCEHGTWYFVAWHRMYVYFFESIVRSVITSLGGPPDWALPYWDYTPPTGNPTLPLPFRDPNSPLYVWERRVTPYNVNGGDPLPNAVTSIALPMSTVPFVPPGKPITGFGGQVTSPVHLNGGFGALEQQPHNVVHDAVGGPYGWMADVNFAAQDPIFWLHHANIDRLWVQWIGLGRSDTTDQAWVLQPFTFYDANRALQTLIPHQVEDTTKLGYVYDRVTSAAAVAAPAAEATPPGPTEIVGSSSWPVRLTGGRASGVVAIDTRTRDTVLREVEAPRRVLLYLDDVEAERNPGTVYGVYVNLPRDATDADAETYLAGALSFFGIEGSGRRADGSDHVHSYSAGYDITELVRALGERGAWDGEHVEVTFHPLGVPLAEPVAETGLPVVTVGRISVHYA